MEPQTGPQPLDPIIGQTIGNYLVIQKLGEGGMGSVYLAEHPTIGKRVALKILHPEFSTNAEVTERFFTEARAVNAIAHRNIIDIIDYGAVDEGVRGGRLVYIIMEYLQGETLAETLRADAPLPPERAFAITMQVAGALAASHRCNVVHRDLKPDNIMLTTRGDERDVVKLVDFGIAKLMNDGHTSSRTRTGLVLGTPAYMSPEQCEGSAKIDQRADIYALGVCLYEMLVGRVPFIGESYGDVLVQHLTQRPIAPSQYRLLPAHVEQVVLKALEKRPELRYPTMDEFTGALADPIGYVETHGGIGEFLSREISAASTPLPRRMATALPIEVSSPSMVSFPNPLAPGNQASGKAGSASTTLSSASGQVAPRGGNVGVVIASVIIAAGLGAGVFWLRHFRHRPSLEPEPTTDIVMSSSGSVADDRTPSTPLNNPGSGEQPVTGAAEGSASAGPELMVTLQINSNPEGAEIFLNNRDTGKTTYAKLQYPRKRKSATITLRLKGYEDYVIPRFALNRDEITKSVTLKAVVAKPLSHSGSNSNGVNNGVNNSKACDTCLERPE